MAANLELVYKCLLNCFLVGLGKRSKLPDPRMRIQRQNPQNPSNGNSEVRTQRERERERERPVGFCHMACFHWLRFRGVAFGPFVEVGIGRFAFLFLPFG
jgi:hypothetical protein